MSWLRSLFGPSRDEIWRQLAREIEGRYVDGGMLGTDAIQVRSDDWILTLDTYTVSTGKSSVTYTRMRAPFVNEEGLRFQISRAGFIHAIFGQNDIEIGVPRFDDEFVIKGDQPEGVRELLAQERIRELMLAQPSFNLSVKDDEGWFGPSFPDGVDELYFAVTGVIKDIDRLKALFELFAEVLSRLCHMARAYDDDVELLIADLVAPGGTVTSDVLLWDGAPARHRAVAGLLRKGDPRALPALASVVRDEDDVLAAKAVLALGGLGDPRAVSALIPLLGVYRRLEGRPARQYAAQALVQLGQQGLVDSIERAMGGYTGDLVAAVGGFRSEVVEAFLNAVETDNPVSITNGALALAELGAIEAIPALRARKRAVRRAPETVRASFEAALDALDVRAALPRPASPAGPTTDTLPKPATTSDRVQEAPETLPRPSTGSQDEEKP